MNRHIMSVTGSLATLCVTGMAQQSPPPGKAMHFDGASGHVRIEDHPLLDVGRTATIEMWVKPSSLRGDLITKGDGWHGESDRSFELSVSSDGRVKWDQFMQGGGWVDVPISPPALAVNRWDHVAITYDADTRTVRYYRNGVLTQQSTVWSSIAIRNSSQPVHLARRLLGNGVPINHFHGAMDEVRIWNVVRTPEQVIESYNMIVAPDSPGLVAHYDFEEGDGEIVQDRTGNGLHGTVGGGVTWVDVICSPPSVTSQPVAQTTCTGAPASFTASFAGSSPAFQWRRSGQAIPGETERTLTVTSPSAADAGIYDCVATNECGSVVTSGATLTVIPLLKVASQPLDQNVGVDTPVSFVVEIESIDGCETPLAFQWQRRDPTVTDPNAPGAWIDLSDDSRFMHARTGGLIINRPIPAFATGFRCRIGGGCGCRPASGFIYSEVVNFTIACPADFNADGGVDFGDIEAFFVRWEDGC